MKNIKVNNKTSEELFSLSKYLFFIKFALEYKISWTFFYVTNVIHFLQIISMIIDSNYPFWEDNSRIRILFKLIKYTHLEELYNSKSLSTAIIISLNLAASSTLVVLYVTA